MTGRCFTPLLHRSFSPSVHHPYSSTLFILYYRNVRTELTQEDAHDTLGSYAQFEGCGS
jgi:hypothetical protein